LINTTTNNNNNYNYKYTSNTQTQRIFKSKISNDVLLGTMRTVIMRTESTGGVSFSDEKTWLRSQQSVAK